MEDSPMTKRPLLTDFLAKQGRAPNRQRAPYTPVHDRRAVDVPKGVVPASVVVPCPSGDLTSLTVTINIRGDTLAYMKKRKQISEHQYIAGRHWQALYDRAVIGRIKAMDTTNEPVDGGGMISEGITDGVRDAVKGLARADAAVGLRGVFLIREVLGSGLTIDQVAQSRGMDSKTGKDRLGWMFRGCLDELAVAFGYADKRLLENQKEPETAN